MLAECHEGGGSSVDDEPTREEGHIEEPVKLNFEMCKHLATLNTAAAIKLETACREQ
jgi:hypothetical protein